MAGGSVALERNNESCLMTEHSDFDFGTRSKAAEAVDDYDCPVCGAFKGEPCTVGADRGDEMTTRGVTHVARVELA